jgi:ATP-dependent DNA helicase RecG
VDAELRRRYEALRRPLILAAADGFKGVERITGLGDALRVACDRVLARAAAPAGEPLAAWRARLAGFERLERTAQAVEVARGLRLVQTAAGAVPPATSRAVKAAASAPAPAKKAARPSGRKPAVGKAAAAGAPAPATAATALAEPVTVLRGIGPALAEALAARGVASVEDLLWVLPRRYDDARTVSPLAAVIDAPDGERVTFRARIDGARMVFARGRRWAEVRISDGEARVVIRWFNVRGGMDKRFPTGVDVVLSGPLRRRAGRAEMANPDVLAVGDDPAAPRIIPRYPDIAGVPAARLRTACAAALARVGQVADDGVPAAVAARAGVGPLAEALAVLHAPPADLAPADVAALDAGTSPWQRRLAWGELFVLGVVVARRRRERRGDVAVPCAPRPGLDRALAEALPFAPTGAQRRAIAEIGADLAAAAPMNRLLQGDVGAGKTAVAFAAALQVARAGRQTALMVPTEILAEQHHANLSAWAGRAGLKTTLLTASVPRGVRASRLALIAGGEVDVVVGTHALLSEGVGFDRLGLAVIDEQHRFGVAQRVRLRGKSDDGAPHLLVMTATPIPRTLALTAYGDLDVTVLDELPPGRTPPATEVLWGARGRTRAYKVVAERVAAGERAFVVCPRVEAADEDDDDGSRGRDRADATTVAAELAARLAPARVGLVHGRLPTPEREAQMAAFSRGDLDVLVATTVIEVGVDVPAATVMVVEDADGFGLAQLHQLRGRVGRGGGRSWCLLLARGPATEDGQRRLAVLAETCDGFRIAEEDLLLRGPGELLGARQAGLPAMRFGDLRQHTELLLEARREAEAVVADDSALARPEHAGLRDALVRRLRGGQAFGAEGG